MKPIWIRLTNRSVTTLSLNLANDGVNKKACCVIIACNPVVLSIDNPFSINTANKSAFASGNLFFTYSFTFPPALLTAIYGGFVTTASYFCASASASCTSGNNSLNAVSRDIFISSVISAKRLYKADQSCGVTVRIEPYSFASCSSLMMVSIAAVRFAAPLQK